MISYLKRKTPKKIKRNIMKLIVFPYLYYFEYIKKRKVWLRWNSSDVNVFYHTFIENEYLIPSAIDNPLIIIDAGANNGLTALLFALKYPKAKLIAIEPETSNFKFLKKNTFGIENIIPIQFGLWSSDINLRIENPENEKWAFITKEVKINEEYDIEGLSVDTLIANYKIETIDIFKIDIEGSEKELFSKNEEKWLPKTKWIVIELHGPECKAVFEKTMLKYQFKLMFINGENWYYANTKLVNV